MKYVLNFDGFHTAGDRSKFYYRFRIHAILNYIYLRHVTRFRGVSAARIRLQIFFKKMSVYIFSENTKRS